MSEEVRYITWDYDSSLAIEYAREGECNGCGECCMATVRFHLEDGEEDAREGGKTTDHQGLWSEYAQGDSRRFFKFDPVDTSAIRICPMLTYTKKCMLHDKGKVLIHSGWPFCPDNVTPFKSCSYSFREINRWEFADAPTP